MTDNTEEEENSEVSTSAELPSLSEFLLTTTDILGLKLSARLVVVCNVCFFFFRERNVHIFYR